MKSVKNVLLLAALGAVLTGCYVVPASSTVRVGDAGSVRTGSNSMQVRLYPTNAVAQQQGPAQAVVSIDQNGHGTFSSYIAGESFTGDATRNTSSRSGKANGAAASGRYISCDYTMNSPTVGTGSCRMSTGATYSMHFSR